MNDIRKPAVASLFYPDDKINLKRMINKFLTNVPSETSDFMKKKNIDNIFAIISPHAGYVYSGQVAAFGYSLLKQKDIDTIILIGPSHYTDFEGYSLTKFKAYETPFGDIPIDEGLNNALIENGEGVFDYLDTAHIKEHSLEVQLPFLQSTLINNFKIVPVLMGRQTLDRVIEGADVFYKTLTARDRNVLFVISSDLSHYHNDETARQLDEKFIEILDSLNTRRLMEAVNHGEVEACGAGPIALISELAKKMNRVNIKNLVYKNSGDTSGDYSRVVGYLSAVLW